MKKKTPIRLLIVDDHPAFRAGLAALCQSEPDLEVVAEGGDGHQAVALYRQFKPDIALMDLRLPGLGGVEAIIAIRAEFPEARVIVVTTYDGDEDLYRAIQSGAQGYLLKDMSKAEIVDHIRAIHAGQSRLAPHLAERLAERRKRRDLSQRELEVLQLVVKGRSNKEIAAALFLSEETVKFHLKTLFTKLDVQDRTEAAISALRQGIVHFE
jgi:two-component system NarL family response regulator